MQKAAPSTKNLLGNSLIKNMSTNIICNMARFAKMQSTGMNIKRNMVIM